MKSGETQTKQRLVWKPADLLVILTINKVLPRYKLSASVSHPEYGHINTWVYLAMTAYNYFVDRLPETTKNICENSP